MRRKFTLALLCFIILNIWSCKKDDITKVATIEYTGPVAADGCDWLINIGSIAYHADNLDDQYKVDKSQVRISYKVTNAKFSCGIISQPGFSVIHISKISKVN